MSYNPSEHYSSELRNPSGIIFFGKDPSKPMLDSASTFLVDEDNSQLKVPNILLSDGDIGVAGNTNAINIASNLVTFSTGVQIDGDLVVNGTTVTVNTETVTIDDNILILNNNATGTATEDAGIEIERGSDTNVKLLWDEGNNYWSISDQNGVSYELATRSGVQELLNKTIDGDKNTFLNIPNSALDNSSVTVNAGTGLTGGGTVQLGNSITINLAASSGLQSFADYVSVKAGTGIVVNNDGVHVGSGVIAQQPFLSSNDVLPNNDTLLILDSGVGLKQITVNELISGADLLTEFSISGANTTNVSLLSEGEKLVFASGTGARAGVVPVVSTDGAGNPVVTLNLNPTSVSAGAYGSASSVAAFIVDANGRLTYATNSGIQIASSQVTNFASDVEAAVFTSANFLDSSTIDFTVAGSTSVSGDVRSNSIGPVHLTASVAGSGLIGGNNVPLHINFDNSTLEVSSDVLRVKDAGIVESKIFRAIQVASTTVTATGDIILASGGSGGITINLPAISTNEGRIIYVKKTDPLSGQVVIDANGTETIDGALTKRLYYQYESMTLVCDASAGWYII